MAKHILIIEDDATIGKAYKLILTQEDYEVSLVTTGKEGLAIAQSKSPDLILLDVLLPDITGWDVFEKLQADEKTKKIPVIVQSNIFSTEREFEFVAAGAKEYLLKSKIDAPVLLKKIAKYLK